MSAFHLFPQLPVELRLAIWRKCLPYRTHELDCANDSILFDLPDHAPAPCTLGDTTEMNERPPVISRVCRESRTVAFETGYFPDYSEDIPRSAYWTNGSGVCGGWEDSVRDSYHLNWTPSYRFHFGSHGSPLHHLAWKASQRRCGGSMMFSFLAQSFDREISVPQRIDALRQMPSWVAVIGVVIVHADFETAAATGLFGLLGDARVQVVEVSDRARVNAFFDLGNKSGFQIVEVSDTPIQDLRGFSVVPEYSEITISEDLRRDSLESIEQKMRQIIVQTFKSEEAIPPIHPAIMFRLCTMMCNRPDTTENHPSGTSA